MGADDIEGVAVARRRLGFWRLFSVVSLKSVLLALTQRDWRGQEHVPRVGGVIFVANHISHFDPLVVAHFVYDLGRWPRFLAKASLFAIPILGGLFRTVEQIPVHRGTVDAAKALDAAVTAVSGGNSVIIYPEGTTTHDPDLWPMRAKTGAARLAVLTGAPIVPLAVWGPQRVFDSKTSRVRLRLRTPVTVAAGPPIDLATWTDELAAGEAPSATALQEITDVIMRRIVDILAEVRGEPAPASQDRARSAEIRVDGEAGS